MEYNWCHNPDCHTIETQSRIRGSGDNKVLRTRKIALSSEWIRESIYAYFCNNSCLFQFLNKFKQEVANIRPVKQPSETPIKVKKVKEQAYRYQYSNGESNQVPYTSTTTIIESINNE
tara:strand:+ start:650 stop:1003 length:354 start_codon:yes stop_codon:yes gene_type:complete